jgi:adenosylcobinamide-phosphate synthase
LAAGRGAAGRSGVGAWRGVAGASVLLGLAADVAFGDPRRWHPVAGFGRLATALERIAYRPTHRAGAVFALVLVGGVTLTAAVIERALPPRMKTLFGAACVWTALGGRSLSREAAAVAALVEAGDVPGARTRVRSLVGRDPEALDGEGLCAAAIESVAENSVDAVVAPLLYAAVAGAPGVVAYRAVNTLDAMVGRRSPRYARFGTASARADDVLNWVPARLAAALTVLIGRDRIGALRAWRRDAGRHPSPNAGQVEAAFAGALGLTLGGTLSYAGRVEHRPRLGDGGPATPADVHKAIRLAQQVTAGAALLSWRLA